MSRNHVRGCTCTRRGYYCAVDRSTPTEYPEAMGGGASKAEKQAAVSEETSTAIEGLSALERMLREPELPPAAVEASTTQATAPAVDEKNAALVAQAAEKPAEPPPPIVVRSHNVWFKNPQWTELIDQIALGAWEHDFLCLQEATDEMLKTLTSKLVGSDHVLLYGGASGSKVAAGLIYKKTRFDLVAGQV